MATNRTLLLLALQLIACAIVGEAATAPILPGVRHLMGEPDFRSVTLRWECDRMYPAPAYGFRVNYCEVQAWGQDRCRLQVINATSSNEVLMAPNSPVRMFFAQIGGLRMATNYSFEVWPVAVGEDQDLISTDLNANLSKTIILETKGFSAKATLCLPQFSEVEVETGPYFGGRIAVEGVDDSIPDDSLVQNSTDDPDTKEKKDSLRTGKRKKQRKGRCWVDGDPESPKTTYTLRIEHNSGEGCGGGSISAINETAVSAFVMVQESRSILTHSARRFLVLCSYQPGTLTVRAGIQLPSGNRADSTVEGLGYADDRGETEATNDVREPRILRQSREKKYEGLIIARARTAEKLTAQENKKSSTSAQLVLMILLVVAGVVGFAVIAVWRLVIAGTKWRHGLLGEYYSSESINGNVTPTEDSNDGSNSDVEAVTQPITDSGSHDANFEESVSAMSESPCQDRERVVVSEINNEETAPDEDDQHVLKIHVQTA
ncbi:uncharacterized protein LOC124155800 [Ischnura elegans]|uniref:uncharacterized protein LOC124155800 n=1 Tax=Ischnura elegans TaxID=197161 RepID=UPI001ED86E1A|nr:uncharacterized protein LOC124155800 [Ischnura elegans]